MPLATHTVPAHAELNAIAASATSSANLENASTIRLADLQDQFQSVADRAAPSVVAISASITPLDSDDALRAESLNGEKLDAILSRTTRTVGSGFVIDPDGYIVTNEHVIGEAQQLWVTTDNDTVYPAIVVGSDPRSDLAVLKIPAAKLSTVTFAPPGSVRRGQWAIALGNPYGLAEMGEMAMSVGIVSAVDRSLPKLSSKENRLYFGLIQTTAEINPGNSGGALFDLHGRVIGINAAVVLPQKQQTNGIGFAIPVTDELLKKIDDLKQGREIVYGYLGVMVSTPTARERREAGISGEIGVIVDTVERDSPAHAAGLKVGDVVTSINGVPMRDSDHFVRVIGAMPVDRASMLDLRRNGRNIALPITTRKRELASSAITRESVRLRWRGLLLGPIPANWNFGNAKRPGTGVMVIGVEANSLAAREGIQAGAVITSIGGKAVADILELQRVINDTPAELCRIDIARPDNVVASGN